MRKYILGAAIALLSATPTLADMTIGWAGPLTGGSAAVGEQNRNGVAQAVEDINASGGILGQKVVVQYEDDAGDPKQAVTVANRLVDSGAKFVIGHQNSGASIPASQVYAEGGVLQITPASTNPKLTEQGLWNVFRTCGRDDQQGKVAGEYLLKHFSQKSVFIVHDKTSYGLGLAQEVQKAINAGGLKEVGFDGIDVGQKDFSALVSRMKQAKADAVYFGGVYGEAGLIVRQMHDQGLKVPMLGGDAMFSSEFAGVAGSAAEGTLITFGPDATKNPAAAEALKGFKKNNIDPEGFTLYGYAAIQVLAEAIKQVGQPDPEAVAKLIHSGASFSTAIGPLSYDDKGDVKRMDFVFYESKGGKFVEIPSN
jgi:branched-chain amino acid transport system substrate-binding protein